MENQYRLPEEFLGTTQFSHTEVMPVELDAETGRRLTGLARSEGMTPNQKLTQILAQYLLDVGRGREPWS
jgi:hypothetical protein